MQEYAHFLSIAKASLSELSYYLSLAMRLGYLSTPQFNQLNGQAEESARTLYGLIQAVLHTGTKVSSLQSHV